MTEDQLLSPAPMGTDAPPSPPVPVVAVLGEGVVPVSRGVVTIDDLGLTRGDGCFDATRVCTDASGRSRIDHLDGHLARLARSATRLGLDDPGASAWTALAESVLAQWNHPGEAGLKFVLTRGREHAPGSVTALAMLAALPAELVASRAGMSVVTLSRGTRSDAFLEAPWLLGGVKTLSYAANLAATREARHRGADEALFVSTDGYLLEGPTSAVLVQQRGQLLTTPLEGTGVLASVTQQAVFSGAAAAGHPTSYRLISLQEATEAEGLWLVSAGRGVAPVLRLNGTACRHDPARTAQLAAWGGFGGC